MKNDKIERSVKRAFVNAAPYQLDKVTEKCKEQKGKVIPLENKQAKKSINKTFARIAAAAAAAAEYKTSHGKHKLSPPEKQGGMSAALNHYMRSLAAGY